MKNIVLSFFMLLACYGHAGAQGFRRSQLRVRLVDHNPITIEVDGRRYEKEGYTLTMGDLPPGRHSIRVYSFAETSAGRRFARLLYRGRVETSAGRTTVCVVNGEHGSIRISVEGDGAGGPYGGTGRDNNYPHHTDGGDDPTPVDPGDYDAPPNNGMTPQDMTDLRTRAEKRITDTDKEGLLKTAVDGRRCSTTQVAEMLRMLSFESTRLDFAKWAFSHVSDRSNYWKLESEFTFSSSKEELDTFIKSQR